MSSPHPVRLGLEAPPQHCRIDELRAVWRIADEAGFAHVWGFDHFAPIAGDVRGDVFEGWSLLAAMAVATQRVRIGVMVTGNTYRHPGVLAKMAVTVDHLSGGRLEFGLGAAWAEVEHIMLGLPFPPVGERIRRMGEALVVLKKLWTEETADFDGRYYALRGAVAGPKPVQRPHPPIWVGGGGEKVTLRYVARHADVWNAGGGELETAVRKSGVLDDHCAAVGRDPGEIRRSRPVQLDPRDPAAAVEELERSVQAGFTENVVSVKSPDIRAAAEIAAADVLPRFAAG
ncbi:MAG TPA: LLM class F420-dependent oxidoreductase [Solirubrobacteraceae bacterium]|nr:LLM class F420-dependent oxidoreductase [Solirubrobacteraceae bacterium]